MTYKATATVLASYILALFIALPLAATALATPALAKAKAPAAAEQTYRIGFHLWKPGKIYDEAMAGIKDGLELAGIRYESVMLQSDRNKALAAENLRKLDEMGLDLIYSLSSAGTKIAKKTELRTPVIATVVNHPSSLGIDKGNGHTGTKLTGTSYYIDAQKQLALYRTLFPKAVRIGMIYDANNPAGYLAEHPFMKEACQALGMEFISVSIKQASELPAAARRLVDAKVDMVVVPTNRLVYGNLGTVLDITNRHNIPVVSMNKQGVENGALAGLFADTYDLGRQAATLARSILFDRVDPSGLPFEYIEEPYMILNLSSAAVLGYEFPDDVLSSATIVMQ